MKQEEGGGRMWREEGTHRTPHWTWQNMACFKAIDREGGTA